MGCDSNRPGASATTGWRYFPTSTFILGLKPFRCQAWISPYAVSIHSGLSIPIPYNGTSGGTFKPRLQQRYKLCLLEFAGRRRKASRSKPNFGSTRAGLMLSTTCTPSPGQATNDMPIFCSLTPVPDLRGHWPLTEHKRLKGFVVLAGTWDSPKSIW